MSKKFKVTYHHKLQFNSKDIDIDEKIHGKKKKYKANLIALHRLDIFNFPGS
jgi:hypothetical protein